MQIVIDILDETYKHMTSKEPKQMTNKDAANWFIVLHKAIFVNGKVLPKGHGRLIDESILREDMERTYKFANELVALGFAESCLEHAPTIIEADKEEDET